MNGIHDSRGKNVRSSAFRRRGSHQTLSSIARRRQMFMLRVVRMLASGRFAPILLEARVLDLLQPDARSVKTDDCIFADDAEEVPPVFLARAMMILVSQMSEHPGLLFGRYFEK